MEKLSSYVASLTGDAKKWCKDKICLVNDLDPFDGCCSLRPTRDWNHTISFCCSVKEVCTWKEKAGIFLTTG